MQRCSELAYAMCPDRAHCGSRTEAVFTDASECAAFNRIVEKLPMINADRASSAPDVEMDALEAIRRIDNHMRVHGIGEYPHIKIAKALHLAIEALKRPQVVWRKDCRYYNGEGCLQTYGEFEPDPMDFCSHGEKRVDE